MAMALPNEGAARSPVKTYEDLRATIADSGRVYGEEKIQRAYALAEKAHKGQRNGDRQRNRRADQSNPKKRFKAQISLKDRSLNARKRSNRQGYTGNRQRNPLPGRTDPGGNRIPKKDYAR